MTTSRHKRPCCRRRGARREIQMAVTGNRLSSGRRRAHASSRRSLRPDDVARQDAQETTTGPFARPPYGGTNSPDHIRMCGYADCGSVASQFYPPVKHTLGRGQQPAQSPTGHYTKATISGATPLANPSIAVAALSATSDPHTRVEERGNSGAASSGPRPQGNRPGVAGNNLTRAASTVAVTPEDDRHPAGAKTSTVASRRSVAR
jgi:hypothetical protein